MFGEQEIDRLLPESLCRRLAIEGELSKLLPRQWVEVDRKYPLPGPARRAAVTDADSRTRCRWRVADRLIAVAAVRGSGR